MHRFFFTAGLLAASAAVAATVTIIPATNLPAAAPDVAFEGLPSDFNSTLSTYTEQALTLSVPRLQGFPTSSRPNSGKYAVIGRYTGGSAEQFTARFSFSVPVSQIAFTELQSPMNSITLFADEAATQSLGTFNTTHARPVTFQDFAFQSDTPFRSFTASSNTATSFWIDDLRYNNAVPEPTAIVAVGLIIAAAGLRRHRA